MIEGRSRALRTRLAVDVIFAYARSHAAEKPDRQAARALMTGGKPLVERRSDLAPADAVFHTRSVR